MEREGSSKYVDQQVYERLNGPTAHLVDLGFKNGQLDPQDINPDYDVVIDEDLSDYNFQEGADPYPVVDVLSESYLDRVSLDTDRGYFEFETESGDTAEGWMPILDEGKAEGVFLIQHPWTGEARLGDYNGFESDIGDEFSGIEPMLQSAYRTAREHIPDKGQRNQDFGMNEFKSRFNDFKSDISDIEGRKAEGEIDPGKHYGKIRGRDAISLFSKVMKRSLQANLVDYPVANEFGNNTFERTAGGYKTLTDLPDSAPYDTMEEAIEFRYPDSWIDREQS